MDPTKIRTRYLVVILLSALVTAAVLRHVLHTNVGFSRWEILEGALICLALTAFLGLTLRLLRREEFKTLMDATQIRTRYLVVILLSALITAAVLRHVLHTNVGFSRWEILEGAVTCLALTAFLGLTLRLLRREEFNTLMDPTQIRTSYLVVILLSALITAAVLRHVLHTNVGFSRWEILEGAVTCLALTAFLGLTLRLLRRD